MLENLFRGLFDSDLTSVISVTDFLLCLGFSLVLGLVMAFAYMYRTQYTKSFVVTLASRSCLCCYFISEWKCGNRCCCSRRFQPCAFSFSTGQCERDLYAVPCYGRRFNCRYGLSWLCSTLYIGHVCHVYAV